MGRKGKIKLSTQNWSEKDSLRKKLEQLIEDTDIIEVLSHLSFFSQYILEDSSETMIDFKDKPILHLLLGLCLKHKDFKKRAPKLREIENIISLANRYFDLCSLELLFRGKNKTSMSETDSLVLAARLQKVISPINQYMYKFQLDEFLKNLYSKFDGYYSGELGFTSLEALKFGEKIIKRYERLTNERVGRAKRLGEKEGLHTLYSNMKELFLFEVDEFCTEEKIREPDKFHNYIKTLSCKLGTGNKNYETPLDDNLIVANPIINIDNCKFFCPIPQDLIFNLPLILEKGLSIEKEKQTKIWQKFQKEKAQFVEDQSYHSCCRIFSRQNVLRNLKYNLNGQEYEVDILIPFDNKIFILESKAGLFTEPARRGGIERLTSDLIKLIGDAYDQAKRVVEYIRSTKNAVFRDTKGKVVFELTLDPKGIDFFLLNITLEPLMKLATGLKDLQSLGIFLENEFPWSANLFEFDIISRHVPYPTIFIHYLEQRLKAQKENVYQGFDELSFLAFYLENGNLSIPQMEDDKSPDLVTLDTNWVRSFDDHYLYGKPSPTLKIETQLDKLIRSFEADRPLGYSNVISALLDLDHNSRDFLLNKLNNLAEKSKRDKKPHDLTVLYKKDLDTGYTLMTQYGENELVHKLNGYCSLKKYRTKTQRWIGLGIDASQSEFLVRTIVYLNFPHQDDKVMDQFLKKRPIKGTDETDIVDQ